MPTQGRFVCHVHCLVHDGAVRSSPCRPHHENFGCNLYHMFVPAYSASQSFVLFWSCGIRAASKSNVDSIPFLKRCSHTSMWTLILLAHRDCFVNPFHRRVFSSGGSDHFNISKINYHFFSTVFVSSVPKLPLFSRPPTLFLQGLRFLNQVSFYWWKSLHFFSFNVLIRWFSRRL